MLLRILLATVCLTPFISSFQAVSATEKKKESSEEEKEHKKKEQPLELTDPLYSALIGGLFLGSVGLVTSPFLLPPDHPNEKKILEESALLENSEIKKLYTASTNEKERTSFFRELSKIKDSDLREKYEELFYRIKIAKTIKEKNYISLYPKEKEFLDRITDFTTLKDPDILQQLESFIDEDLSRVLKRELDLMITDKLSERLISIKKNQVNNWKKIQKLLDDILKVERTR